ncbi:MAG: DUF4125 family protein [Lachnospiraceae bacterium]|nr:DUF4125 family protein [Lachnospiraceae bacterium]
MDMNQVYVTLDEMFACGNNEEAEAFLIEMMKEAGAQQDYNSLIMLLNEMIGFCRETGQKDKSIAYASQVIELEQRLGMEGTVPYATTLLNVANALRAAGKLEEAYRFYMEVFPIYDNNLRPDDFYYASLYNNLSLLLQEMGEYEEAIECLQKALVLAESTQGKEFEVYVTHANIASTLCKLAQLEKEKEEKAGLIIGTDVLPRSREIASEAAREAEEAIEGFMHQQVKDQHMAAALTAYADASVLLGRYLEAERYLKDAAEMVLAVVGKTEAYERILEKYRYVQMHKEEAAKEEEAPAVSEETKKTTEQTEAGIAAATGEEEEAADASTLSGMELSRRYFEAYGKKMLFDGFGEYLDRIAAGLCGEGSECLGFDDALSRDHDFGPGFCLWLDDETYDAIGKDLQKAYDSLPKEFLGVRRMETPQGMGRCGVCRISDYFLRILGSRRIPETMEQWLSIPETALCTATAGEIFTDPQGTFSGMLEKIAYYPDAVWRRHVAQQMTLFSQYGQYNYVRMLKRGDRATATLMVVKATEAAIRLCYLLNRTYAPHDKWLLRGMETLSVMPMAEDIMTALLNNPDVHREQEGVDRIALIEKLAGMFLEQLKAAGLLPSQAEDTYLAAYGEQVAFGTATEEITGAAKEKEKVKSAHDEGIKGEAESMRRKADAVKASEKLVLDSGYTKEDMIDAIVKMEYQAFDEVKNEGGRADCQDNFATFEIMRKSQYMTWNDEMLKQWIYDFKCSMDKGWNLITEKYARMMESTAPEEYAKLKASLPEISPEKKQIIEEIVKVQVQWMEEFSARYPKVAGEARVIHTKEDSAYNTSYETYLRGEISTYTDEMLMLYGRFIAALAQEGKNLAAMTMENTVHMYGYADLDTAEKKMW